MSDEILMGLYFIGACLTCAGYFYAGLKATYYGQKTLLIAGSVIWVCFAASMLVWMANAVGYEGIMPFVFLVFLGGPSLAFAVFGGLVGWLKGRRTNGHNLT